MSDQIEVIENEHKRLTGLVEQVTKFLHETEGKLKSLRNEKQKAIEQLKEIGGAVQAYSQTLGLLKGSVPQQENTVVAQAPAPLEGEVIPADSAQDGSVVA